MSWWKRFLGRDTGDSGGTAHPKKKVKAAAAAHLQHDGAVLLDVREQHEWSAGRAPKARHIPLAQLGARVAREVPGTATVLTICRSGGRSARAAALLRREGYAVIDVAGGMRAWQAADLPVVASGGRPGRVI
ncbi:MAG TPA: rhodanese-like domain-containing protein [Kineosporiaceae bacterium]|jgi:rhodanese-related sulfurtransferase|nr:rhodanese-like domain-containing protein [Kineosporiaceae bacterium]